MAESGIRRQGTKRAKYTERACLQCKRRKVKCSRTDGDPCQQCRNRGVPCRASSVSGSGSQDGDARVDDSPTHRLQTQDEGYPHAPPSSQCDGNATRVPPTDPRVDGLCDRVKTLEDTLAYLLDSAKGVSDPSSSAMPLATATISNHGAETGDDEEDDDQNQFVGVASVPHDLSLSSQVAAMRALLSRPTSPGPDAIKTDVRDSISVTLPEPVMLRHLFDVYFRDFDVYFPILARGEFESQAFTTIRRLGYNSGNLVLSAGIDDLSTIALVCIMLSLAECVDSGEGAYDGDRKPGWKTYLLCRRAIYRFSRSGPLNLDAVRAQCLVSAYLMHCEALREASQAITAAWQLATAYRLNNKKVWPQDEAEQTLQRRQLWWSIYFLDRQISRKSGIAYHIRDTEFDVDDFSGDKDYPIDDPAARPDQPSIITKNYMQALINLARLWGTMWDTFFAVGATKPGDWMEIEIMDTRILNTRVQLPDYLTWDVSKLAEYTLLGENEPQIRRRLHLYTRLELLRMLIRQNPVRQVAFESHAAHLCSRLARQIIVAHDSFICRFPSARATGYFTTSSVVECVYHLALVLHYSKDEHEHAASVTAFRLAHSILIRLSSYNKVADRALKALEGVVRKWGDKHDGHNVNLSEGASDVVTNALLSPWQAGDFGIMQNQFGLEGLEMSFGDWMEGPMSSLLSGDSSFQATTLLE